MTVTHIPQDGGEQTVATDPTVADSLLAKTRGLIARRTMPGDAFVFPFEDIGTRWIHMIGVPFDVATVWVADGTVTKVARLRAWSGLGGAKADTVVELPPGYADLIETGDIVTVDYET